MQNFFSKGEELNYPVGTIIARDGEFKAPDKFKISYIKEGEIAYLKKTKDSKYVSLKFAKDEIIQLEASYNNFKSLAAVVVIKPVKLYKWSKHAFDNMIRQNAEFAAWTIISLSRHLRTLNHTLGAIISGKMDLVTVDEALQDEFYAFNIWEQKFVINEQMSLYNVAFHYKDHMSYEAMQRYTQNFNAREIIFKEGDPCDKLYLILQGTVSVVKKVEDKSTLLDILHPGDVFGEMGIFENKPRSATVIANEFTKVIALDKESFKTVFKLEQSWPSTIIEGFARRINHLYREIEKYTN